MKRKNRKTSRNTANFMPASKQLREAVYGPKKNSRFIGVGGLRRVRRV